MSSANSSLKNPARTYGRWQLVLTALVLLAGTAYGGFEVWRYVQLRNYPNPSIHSAVMKGKIDAVKELLWLGVSVEDANQSGERPLHVVFSPFTTAERRREMLHLLIAHGADLDAQDKNGYTPLNRVLLMQVNKGDTHEIVEHIETLVNAGADLDIPNNDGHTPLTRSLFLSYDHVAEVLIDLGATVGIMDAVLMRDHDRVYAMLDDDPLAVNIGLPDWTSPLMYAFRIHDYELVRGLIDRGADIHGHSKENATPLHYAIGTAREQDWDTLFELLIDRDANINAATEGGNVTPFYIACRRAPFSVVKKLQDMGGDPSVVTGTGSSTLINAARRKDPDGPRVVELLLEAGVDPDIRNDSREGAIHVATSIGAIRSLLTHGANPDLPGNIGIRLMDRLVSSRVFHGKDPKPIIALLLEYGADPNESAFGIAPLDSAIRTNDLDLAKMLLDHGADPQRTGMTGSSPLQTARALKKEPFVTLFEEYEAKAVQASPS